MFGSFDICERDYMKIVRVVIFRLWVIIFFIFCFNMFVLFRDDFLFLKLLMSVIIIVIKWVVGIFLIKKI